MEKYPLISFVIGTRPEAIKMAPVIKCFRENKLIKSRIILTGQHKEMVIQVMDLFNLKPNLNLNIMMDNQSLSYLTTSIIQGLEKEFSENKPSIVLVQGDTTSAFCGALAAFYQKITVGHIEAGLRTSDIYNPFPEEANRKLISQIALLHFAPTKLASSNLKNADVKGEIIMTGNTCVDALKSISKNYNNKLSTNKINWDNQKVLLVTIHRRENWGLNLENICIALKAIIDNNSNASILLPMHKNQEIRNIICKYLSNHSRIELIEPLLYVDLINAMQNSYLILTDSGGLQEEAPSFGKPVLVLRNTTERAESINYGTSKLIGTNKDNIKKEVELILNNNDYYESMVPSINPYGDGKASSRILNCCLEKLNLNY